MKRKNSWEKSKGLKCVILAAGKGSRLLTLTENSPKHMLNLAEKPILDHVVGYWKKYTDDFVFVVNYKKEKIIKYVKKYKDIKSKFVVQRNLNGIAGALLVVEKFVKDKFIVILGDCICKGELELPSNIEQGVGIWMTDNKNDIRNSYSVKLSGSVISQVREKPKKIYNNLCGLGFYFFDKKIFNYIRATPSSALRGEIELTDVIQNMIKSGEKISPILFNGNYLNINTKEELNRAHEILNS